MAGKSGITRLGVSLPLPHPAPPGAPLVGVTEQRHGALGYWLFVLRARPSVGTGAARNGRAWAAQPSAPRVVAGSGAGCQPGGGAEPPRGGGLECAVVAGGRAAGGRGPRLRTLGRGALWPGRAPAGPSPGTRCARGLHTRLAGSQALPGSQLCLGSNAPCPAPALRRSRLTLSLPRCPSCPPFGTPGWAG